MNNLNVLIGLPGVGKTEYAKSFEKEGFVVCSSDDMRERLFGDINDQGHNNEVFKAVHEEIRYYLKAGYDVIFDACNINSKKRRRFLNSIKDIECTKEAHILVAPYEVILEQNKNRERVVPKKCIQRMYKAWETPALWEGFDDIKLICGIPGDQFDIEKYDGYDQNNPYHKLPLGEHMRSAAEYIGKKTDDPVLVEAALRHDSGKPFCEFKDENGISHYYGHAGVGAYDVLTDWQYSDEDALKISQLISYHMYPLTWNDEKVKEKYRKIWGEDFFNEIMLLHKADAA